MFDLFHFLVLVGQVLEGTVEEEVGETHTNPVVLDGKHVHEALEDMVGGHRPSLRVLERD